jgi:uncharacterized membrane protein (DUF2068 family)
MKEGTKKVKRYKIAAILLIIHGIIEIAGFFAVLPIWLFGAEQTAVISFAMPFLQDNLNLAIVAGVIWGTIRIIGAIGLFKNLMWGFALSMINSTITLALMIFMLPFGIKDGVIACIVLVLLLTQYFGKKKIIE